MLKVKVIIDNDEKVSLESKVNKFLSNINANKVRTITYHQGTSAYNTGEYYPLCFITYEETP